MATFPLFENPRKAEESTDQTNSDSDGKPKSFEYQLTSCGDNLTQIVKECPNEDTNVRVWKASDELKLLDAIGRFGYGNWEAIHQTMSQSVKGVTVPEVMEHYLVHYVLTDVGDQSMDWKQSPREISAILNSYKNPVNCKENLEQNAHEAPLDELGQLKYMQKRGDYSVEFDDAAEEETVKAIMAVSGENEDEYETEYLLANIEVYNSRLLNRFRMKSLVDKHALVDKFFQSTDRPRPMPVAKRKSKSPRCSKTVGEELELKQSETLLKPFSQFLDPKEMQDLYLGLKREFALKMLVRKFLQYKRHGFINFEQIKQFEMDRSQKREKSKLRLRFTL